MYTAKRFLSALLLVAAVCGGVAADESLHRVLSDGQWGFINSSGSIVVEPQYDYAFPYRAGFTVVRTGDTRTGKRAYLNAAGEPITDFMFDRAYHFVNGFGTAVLDGHWVFVRPDGSILAPAEYDSVLDFQDGYAGVRTRTEDGRFWGLIDRDGVEVLPTEYARLSYAGAGTWWVSRTGSDYALYQPGAQEPIEFPYSWRTSFRDGVAVVRAPQGSYDAYRVITPDEEVLYDTTLVIASASPEIMIVRMPEGRRYLRYDGTALTNDAYFSAELFVGDVARVAVGTSWSNLRWSLLRSDGSDVLDTTYDHIGAFDESGIARVRNGDAFGFVTSDGSEISPPQWDQTGEFREGLCPVLRDGKWGYIDRTGTIAIPLEYDFAWDFGSGFAVVRQGDHDTGERFYIDHEGNYLTDRRFDWAYNFDRGLAHVAEGDFDEGRFGYVGDNGEILWEPSR